MIRTNHLRGTSTYDYYFILRIVRIKKINIYQSVPQYRLVLENPEYKLVLDIGEMRRYSTITSIKRFQYAFGGGGSCKKKLGWPGDAWIPSPLFSLFP